MSTDQQRTVAQRPIAAVGIVLFEGERVLLVQRRHPPHTDCWTIPGGKVRFGETLADAAQREMREETGLDVKTLRPLHIAELIDAPNANASYHYIVIDIAARLIGGTLQAADDVADARWFTREELERAAIERNSRALIDRVFAGEFEDVVETRGPIK